MVLMPLLPVVRGSFVLAHGEAVTPAGEQGSLTSEVFAEETSICSVAVSRSLG